MISAILLCYNQKRFIKEQFRAILKQDYLGEWEIIISDDFSQDGSFECLEEMVEKEGEGRRIILHRNESNRGIAGNLQCAVHLSRGEWIIKFDGDDIAREDRISSLASLAEKYPGHLVYCHSYNEIDEDGQPAYGRMLPDSDSVVVKPTGNVFLTFPMFTAVLAEMPCTTGLCSATSNICLQGPALRTIQCCPCAPI